MSSRTGFILCDYFTAKGQRVERLFISTEQDSVASEIAVATLDPASIKAGLKQLETEAAASGDATSHDEAALALHALLNQVADENISIHDAREIASIGVDFKKAISIPEIVPTLDTTYGANAASWVRGIFPHLNLGHPGLN